jgi:septal ring factor EnvC (AmiA/AmiB activator)
MSSADAAELQTIVNSLREVLRSQANEVSNLKRQLATTKMVDPAAAEREAKLQAQLEQLNREREEEARCL